MPEQAQGDAVQRAAGRFLAEVRDHPAADAAVKEHARVGLVARLRAVTGPAADVQAPAVVEANMRAVRAQGRLEEAVLPVDHGLLELSVAGVEVVHLDVAPTPDQLASAAGQDGDVIAVVDVVAVDDAIS